MSKLLTQAEISQLRALIEDYSYPVITQFQGFKLLAHIEALDAELKSTGSRLHEVATACANAEAELKRRDELAGKPVGYQKIMYVCEECHDNAPEYCGHDRDEIYVAQDGRYLCDNCAETDENIPDYRVLPHPPILYAAPAAPAVPDELEPTSYAPDYADGWNACRAAMLANKERE